MVRKEGGLWERGGRRDGGARIRHRPLVQRNWNMGLPGIVWVPEFSGVSLSHLEPSLDRWD